MGSVILNGRWRPTELFVWLHGDLGIIVIPVKRDFGALFVESMHNLRLLCRLNLRHAGFILSRRDRHASLGRCDTVQAAMRSVMIFDRRLQSVYLFYLTIKTGLYFARYTWTGPEFVPRELSEMFICYMSGTGFDFGFTPNDAAQFKSIHLG